MLTSNGRNGFTLVEVIVALVILSAAVLGVSGSTATLVTTASQAELRAAALYSVEDRLAQISIDRRYGELDSLYAGTETDVLDVAGFDRTTTIDHVQQVSPPLEYKVVTVSVDGPTFTAPVARRTIIAAP